jgi:MinD-like ATPase involved in chromosome partitioning or flagellar assembly
MMQSIRFDDVLAKIVDIICNFQHANLLQSVTLIRDPLGRVQLALAWKAEGEGRQRIPEWVAELEHKCREGLGIYWRSVIWTLTGMEEQLSEPGAQQLMRQARGDSGQQAWSALWEEICAQRVPWSHPLTKTSAFAWYKIEKVFSNASWLTPPAKPLWPLDAQNPAVVAFHSFKGGVGRTLSVAAVALILAQNGQNVAILDLDLEAPGLGELFFDVENFDLGVVDYLLAYQLTGQRPSTLSRHVANITDSTLIGDIYQQPIRLLPAGPIDTNFPEKISRLDWGASMRTQISGDALKALLRHVRDQYSPDFVLLDSRSGLHDLGGLSLLHLSHLAILLGRDTSASWHGLQVILELFRDAPHAPLFFLVEALVRPEELNGELWDLDYQSRAQQIMMEISYPKDLPDLGFSLYGVPIVYDKTLHAVTRINESVAERLTGAESDYVRLTQEICLQVERTCF